MGSFRPDHEVERRGPGYQRRGRGEGPNGTHRARLSRIPGEVSNVNMRIVMTPGERDAIRQVAKELGIAVSELFRQAANTLVAEYREGDSIFGNNRRARRTAAERKRRVLLKNVHAEVLELLRLETEQHDSEPRADHRRGGSTLEVAAIKRADEELEGGDDERTSDREMPEV